MENKGISLLDNYIYLYHLEKFCLIPTYPDSIQDSMRSSFEETQALSRSAPVFSYKNSGPRSVHISLTLHRDMMNDLNRDISNLKDNVVDFRGDDYVDTLIKYLQSCSLPKYNSYSGGSKGVIPPMVAVRFGNNIFIKGVINSEISITWKKPITVNNKYIQCEISFNITESDPYDAVSVASEGSFRGLTRTFKDGIFKSETLGPIMNTVNSVDTNNASGSNEDIKSKSVNQKITPRVWGGK